MGETTTEEQKRKSLDQKLKTLFESGFMGLNIKFDCI
jgi:hypothetical protein